MARKPSQRSIDAAIDALLPSSRRNEMADAQDSGVFACNNPEHRAADQAGMTPGGFIDHAFSRKAAVDKCDALAVLKVLAGRGVLTVAEITARRQTGASPKISDVLARLA